MKKNNQLVEVNRKDAFFASICSADRCIDTSVSPTIVELTGHCRDGSGIGVQFIMGCHANDAKVYSIYKNGAKKIKSLRDNGGRLAVTVNGTIIAVNELIFQLWIMSLGFPCKSGEYNHHYPACWAGFDGEIFAPTSGDVCSPEQNKAHWNCLRRIYAETGYKCSMDTYSKGYSILSQNAITRNLVQQYDALGYLTIMQDDGDPNKGVN